MIPYHTNALDADKVLSVIAGAEVLEAYHFFIDIYVLGPQS